MTTGRIYGAASGECLFRDGDPAADEQSRVQHDFHAGIRLVVDSTHDEVRGFVPAKRRSAEAFFAVVDIAANDVRPIETFYTTVTAMFEARPGWSLRYDVPEGEPFRRRSRASSGNDPSLSETLDSHLSTGQDGPIQIGVTDIVTAVDLIDRHFDEWSDVSVAVGLRTTDRITYDVLFVFREQTEAIMRIDEPETDDSVPNRLPGLGALWRWWRE